jgi:glycerol 3-phosphatase-2
MTRLVAAPEVAELDGLIVDLDGVVWLGDVVIPGSAEAILALQAREIRLVFLTNDPRGSRMEYVERLTQLGVVVDEGGIVTSAGALAACIAESEDVSTPVFAIGSPALKAELAAVGLEVRTEDDGRDAAVVAVGGHDRFDYRELRIATQALRRGARLYAAGRDATFPMPDGPWPATGAVLAAVETAGGVRATVVGKPEPFIFEIARSRLRGCQRVAIVGDHLEADVAGGRRAGLTTILVLSGTATRHDLGEARVQPDLVLPDLAALVEMLPRTEA